MKNTTRLIAIAVGLFFTFGANAADTKAKGLPFSKEASMAKLFASEKANKACYTALQLMGGYGYVKDFNRCSHETVPYE